MPFWEFLDVARLEWDKCIGGLGVIWSEVVVDSPVKGMTWSCAWVERMAPDASASRRVALEKGCGGNETREAVEGTDSGQPL